MQPGEKEHILALIENHGLITSQSLNGSPSKSTYFYELISKAENIGINKDEIQKSYDIGYEKGIAKIKEKSLRKVHGIKK